jgi:hypothetical protein
MQQEDYERETGVAFNLERLTKEVDGCRAPIALR